MSDDIKKATSDDRLLFSTENGWVRHCPCHNVMILHFAGYWMALTQPQYREFHAGLISTVRCPIGQRQLNAGGRFAFRSSGSEQTAFSLDGEGMEELLWLLDSARFMLEARDAAARGYSESTKVGGNHHRPEYREEGFSDR